MHSLDSVTSQLHFKNYLGVRTCQLLVHSSIPYRLISRNEKSLSCVWKCPPRFHKVVQVQTVVRKKHVPGIKVVATAEESAILHSDESFVHGLGLSQGSNLASSEESTILHSDESIVHGLGLSQRSSARVDEDDPELDDYERERRRKISKSNKGKVPWNKGMKHSPKTIKKIKENTKIAMIDPKVKLKLANRLNRRRTLQERENISTGLKAIWAQRHEEILIKESFCFVWQNAIAEASRTGFSGQEELQWNSSEILSEQLKEEWLRRKRYLRLPKPNVRRRLPMSPEHRRKISEAVYAKWQDPEYQKRCREGNANRDPNARKSIRRLPLSPEHRRKISEAVYAKWQDPEYQKRCHEGHANRDPNARKSIRKQSLHGCRSPTEISPSEFGSLVMGRSVLTYKDPATAAKLEMIKEVGEQRSGMEAQKQEAAQEARLLIEEGEKATKLLEAVTSPNPLLDDHEVPTWKNGGDTNIEPSPSMPSQPDCDLPFWSANQETKKSHINSHPQKPSTGMMLEQNMRTPQGTWSQIVGGIISSLLNQMKFICKVIGHPPR